MPTPKDITGRRFGRLVAIERAGSVRHGRLWRCRCDCGREHVVVAGYLRSGSIRSCGCLQRQRASEHARTHGRSGSPVYVVWENMIARCCNPKHTSYPDYGGRGVKVCERWRKFENFLTDMGERPAGRTLDRVNSGGNYELDNCRWATRKEQNRNTRGTKLTPETAEKIRSDPRLQKIIAAEYGVDPSVVSDIKRGQSWS